ncbi:MAG: tetratricopeptide repeat protein [Candidatus Rokuibacteriota bacterium]
MGLAFALIVGAVGPADGLAAGSPAEAPLGRAARLNDEAVQHLREARYREGIAKAREALALREQALGPRHPDVAVTLNNLATLHAGNGEYAAARPLYERAVRIWEEARGPDDVEVATTLNNLAVLLRLTGEHAAARPLYERVLRIRERALGPGHPDVARVLSNMSVLAEAVADYPAARSLAERALGISEQAFGPQHPDVATALNNLAFVLSAAGDYEGAQFYYERALGIWERAHGPEHPTVAQVLSNYALLRRATGRYVEARRLLERALRIWERTVGSDHPDYATGLQNLASVLDVAGDYEAARRLYEDALRIGEKALGPTHPTVATTVNSLGVLMRLTGDHAGARALYERALDIRRKTLRPGHPAIATAMSNLAYLLHLTGDSARTVQLAEEALTIRQRAFGPDHSDVVASLTTLAIVLQVRGDTIRATALYERVLQITAAHPAPEWRWRAALHLGRIHEQANRLQDALAAYQESVSALGSLGNQFGDEASRASYVRGNDRLEAYDALAGLLLKLHEQDPTRGYGRHAWAVLEAKRGRIVADVLGTTRFEPHSAAVRAEAERAQATQQKAAVLARALAEERAKAPGEQQPEREQNLTIQLARTKPEYQAQWSAFLAKYPKYKTLFVEQNTVDARAAAKFAARLAPGTLAVQYFAAPDALYLFVVGPGGLFQVKRHDVAQRELYALVERYREQIELARAGVRGPDGQPDVRALRSLGRSLTRHLLDPIGPELDAHAGLILIPNDLLHYVPVHALPRESAGGSSRFLAETHTVSYVTRQEMVETFLSPSGPSANLPLLALADPDGTLPSASDEVKALRAIRPAVTALGGKQATKARFLSLVTGFRDLHLATHGRLDPIRPERSYLLMAGDDEASRRLEIVEIVGLDLQHGGLVVLSACETALGEQVPGAALVSLAGAFSAGGSSSIVASLWRIDDEATRDFMVAFHRALQSHGRATALQMAQLALLRNSARAHPYYWAGFVLIGAR